MKRKFVAINYIQCDQDYANRFEELFATRVHAIDKLPGFVDMQVLRPSNDKDEYLIVSHWNSEEDFKSWTKSSEFIEGHKRGFADIRKAKEQGEKPPMTSSFKTYQVIAN